MPFAFILLIWRAAVTMKVIAAFRIFHSGIVRRFPFLFVWLSLAAFRSILLMSHLGQRSVVYSASAPLILALEAATVVEIFREATRTRRFHSLGTAFLAGVGFVSVLASLLSQYALRPERLYAIQAMLLIERCAMLAMVLVMAALAWLLWFTRVLPVEPIGRRSVAIMTVHCGMGLVITAGSLYTGLNNTFFTRLLPVTTDLVTASLWAWWFASAPVAVREPETASRAEMMMATAQTARNLEALRSAVETTGL